MNFGGRGNIYAIIINTDIKNKTHASCIEVRYISKQTGTKIKAINYTNKWEK